MSRWDSWLGFLTTCPHCGLATAREWWPRLRLWTSLILGPLSFFLFLRPALAFSALLVWVGAGLSFDSVLSGSWRGRVPLPDAVELGAFLVLLLAPPLLHAAAWLRHRHALKRPAG